MKQVLNFDSSNDSTPYRNNHDIANFLSDQDVFSLSNSKEELPQERK